MCKKVKTKGKRGRPSMIEKKPWGPIVDILIVLGFGSIRIYKLLTECFVSVEFTESALQQYIRRNFSVIESSEKLKERELLPPESPFGRPKAKNSSPLGRLQGILDEGEAYRRALKEKNIPFPVSAGDEIRAVVAMHKMMGEPVLISDRDKKVAALQEALMAGFSYAMTLLDNPAKQEDAMSKFHGEYYRAAKKYGLDDKPPGIDVKQSKDTGE